MQLNMLGIGFSLSPAIVRHVQDRISRSLGSASDRMDKVVVRLTDINGDRGGEDMRCRMNLRLKNGPTVVVEAINRDLYSAIDSAALRAKEAVWRYLKKRRAIRRASAQRSARHLG